jgi:hypothetical protein
MVVAFATADDLGTRMKREFNEGESAWLDELLADATAYLQREIGQLVHPRQTVTFTDWPSAGWVDLPQWPVVSVDAVTRQGAPVEFDDRPGRIRVRTDEKVDVTFTYGYAECPRDLIGLCCSLVSQQLLLVEAGLGLSIGGLSSVALDDFKIAFANGGEGTGLTLPQVTIDGLRQSYGRGTVTQLDVYS